LPPIVANVAHCGEALATSASATTDNAAEGGRRRGRSSDERADAGAVSADRKRVERNPSRSTSRCGRSSGPYQLHQIGAAGDEFGSGSCAAASAASIVAGIASVKFSIAQPPCHHVLDRGEDVRIGAAAAILPLIHSRIAESDTARPSSTNATADMIWPGVQ